jgi:thioesterase domain-containing protein/acyl carrier protein
VAGAAVTLDGGADGAGFLAAHVQPGKLKAPDEAELRRELRALLPEAMVPSVFLFSDQLPRLASGKVDRLALPAAERRPVASVRAHRASSSPGTTAELALAGIWCELLGLDRVDNDDNFFDLGGDSLQASLLVARIEMRFRRWVPLSALLQHTTLGGLAGYLSSEDETAPEGLLVTIQPLGDRLPIFFFTGIDGKMLAVRDLASNLGSEHPLFGLHGVTYSDAARNFTTIEQAAEQYVAEVRKVRRHGPYILVGCSFGGHLAVETARRLAAPGEAEPVVVLIDTYPPVPWRRPTLGERARFHFDSLRKFDGMRAVAEYLRGRRHRICLRLVRHRLTRGIGRRLIAPDSSPISAAQIALASYKPRPYQGRVVLFKASQHEWDPMHAWSTFISGEMEIRTMPGDHNSLINNPYAIELARQLREVIHERFPPHDT